MTGSTTTRGVRVLGTLALAAALLPWAGLRAEGDDPDDRTGGEGDRVQRRTEWFYDSRRAGTLSGVEMAARWRAAVAETRAAIELQRLRRLDMPESTHDTWISKGPSPSGFGGWTFGDISGRVAALAADWGGGILYVGTASGGLWKSVDDGASWTSIFDQAGTMTIGAVTVDPNDPSTLWVGTGENNQGCESYFGLGLMRSTDGGATWELRNGSGANTLDDLASFVSIDIDPRDSNRLVTGGRIRGCADGSAQAGAIYTSDDAGLTWTNRLDNVSIYEIQRDPQVFDTLWAATSDGIYRSTDNAVSWTLQTKSQLPNIGVGRTELAIAPGNGNVVYALFQSAGFWRTRNGGKKWTAMSYGNQACDGQCSYNMVVRVDPTDADVVVRGTVHVFRSVNGGGNWTDLSNNWGSAQKVHQDTHVLLFDPDNPGTFYVGSDGGLWKTTDNGTTFVNKNGNLNVTQFYAVGVHPTDPDTICGGAQDNSSLARNTASDRWELQVATGDGFVCQFNPADPSYAYATSYPSGGRPSIYRSTGGVFGSFSRITNAGSGIESGRANWVTPYLLDPVSPSVLYVGTERVYRSLDHGTSWAPVGPADLTGGFGNIKALAINRNSPAVLFAGTTDGKVWRSSDGGDTWADITAGLPSREINDVAADPFDSDRGFAVVGGFGTAHVWEWTASGGWTPRDTGLPDVPTNTVLLRNSQNVFVGNDVGLFRSIDGGATFEPYMDGLPQGLVVTDLRYNETLDMLTAGTYGRGAWQVTVGSIGGGTPPGVVPGTTLFTLLPGGEVQADWPDACNSGALPGQAYSIQAGDLDQLHGAGVYTHAPLDGDCARTSPAVFTPGPGNEYYLVVPNDGGREGGAGDDSTGTPRPQISAACGNREVDACP